MDWMNVPVSEMLATGSSFDGKSALFAIVGAWELGTAAAIAGRGELEIFFNLVISRTHFPGMRLRKTSNQNITKLVTKLQGLK